MLPAVPNLFVRSLKRIPVLRSFHAVAVNCGDQEKLNSPNERHRKNLTYQTHQQNHNRQISSESVRGTLTHIATDYFGPDALFVNTAMKFLTFCHDHTGLPWWATICVVTVGLKAFVVFPLSVHARKAEGRRSKMNEKMVTELLPQLEKEVRAHARSRGYTPEDAKSIFNANRNKLVREYYIKENCHPLKGFASVLTQLPIWLSLSFSLRHLSGSFYWADKTQAAQFIAEGMKTEGTLWFSNFFTPDQLYILPIILLTTNLTIAAINLYDINRLKRGGVAKALTGIMMFYSVAIFSISTLMPSCITFYWSLSALCSLVQLLLLNNKMIQGVLDIPDLEQLMKKRIQNSKQPKDNDKSNN